jgi:hypothetical protein
MSVSQILDRIDETQKLGKSNVRPVTGRLRYFILLANSREYKEGEAAFCRGLTPRNNPYPFRSPKYWRWHEGLLGNGHPKVFMTSFPREFKPLPIAEGTRQGNHHMAGNNS